MIIYSDTIADILARPAEPKLTAVSSPPFRLRHGAVGESCTDAGSENCRRRAQIVFGDDYPFCAGPAKHLQGLQKCGFSADELQGIYRQNALRKVPQYGA
jgi:hypothetical protein